VYGVSAVFLDECQSYPFIMAMDVDEMFRVEADGEPAYTSRQILEGDVVLSDTEIGYWDTKLSRSYPNPLLVKLTRGMWAVSDSFTLYGNCSWNRGGSIARSGVVPHVSLLPSIVHRAPHSSYCWQPTELRFH
jgi:hypothetical protein